MKQPENVCLKKIKLLALIKTSYNGSTRRQMIRNMFEQMMDKNDYELYFLIGYIHEEKVSYAGLQFVIGKGKRIFVKTDKRIIQETTEHNDLIIGDFEDTYENLPIKTLLGYQFISERQGKSKINRQIGTNVQSQLMGVVKAIWSFLESALHSEQRSNFV